VLQDLENMQAQYEGLLTCGQMISGAVYGKLNASQFFSLMFLFILQISSSYVAELVFH
jgi:hypothetical protein